MLNFTSVCCLFLNNSCQNHIMELCWTSSSHYVPGMHWQNSAFIHSQHFRYSKQLQKFWVRSFANGYKRLVPLLTHKNSQKRQVLDIGRRLLQLVKQERAEGYLNKGKVAKEGGGKVRY